MAVIVAVAVAIAVVAAVTVVVVVVANEVAVDDETQILLAGLWGQK
jgi:hypothetical protein